MSTLPEVAAIDSRVLTRLSPRQTPKARSDAFRVVMGQFASGVTIVSTRVDGTNFGATASAFSSLSLDPPMALVCLFRGAATEEAVRTSGRFGISILRDDQGTVAERFASRHPDRFATVDHRYGELGVPLIGDALAQIECRVAEAVKGGTHTVFLGEVHNAVRYQGKPLAYHGGAFGHFLPGDDVAAYTAIRAMIVADGLQPGHQLSVDELSTSLSVEPAGVLAALKRLSSEKCVQRDPQGGYVVAGLDLRTVLDMISAARTIEAGVAQLTVGWVEDTDIDELARSAIEPCRALPGRPPAPLEDKGPDFHERLVSLAGNPRLLSHYRELSMASACPYVTEAGSVEASVEHAAIVEGFRDGDLQAVNAAIDRHARQLREAWQRASGQM